MPEDSQKELVVVTAQVEQVKPVPGGKQPTVSDDPEMTLTSDTAGQWKNPVLQFVGRSKKKLLGLAGNRRIYRLVHDYLFTFGPEHARKRLWMKRGYEYDKASTPVNGILGAISTFLGYIPDGENEGGSLFHDRFYQEHWKFVPGEFEFHTQLPTGEWQIDSSPWKKEQVDDLLASMTELAGMPHLNAQVEKWAVTLYPPNWFK